MVREASPETPVDLKTLPNEMEAGLIQSILDDAGIESWAVDASDWMLGTFGATSFKPTTVQVRAADLERARTLLDRNREDSVDIDWSKVELGDAEGQAGLEEQTHPRLPRARVASTVVVVAMILATIMMWDATYTVSVWGSVAMVAVPLGLLSAIFLQVRAALKKLRDPAE